MRGEVGSDGAPMAGDAAADAREDRERPAAFRIVRVVSVEVLLPDPYPLVTLEDTEGSGKQISFRIGTSEGASLAAALFGVSSARPSTHELFATALDQAGVDIVAFRIVGRVGVTYLGELELVGGTGRQVLSCRPSDGISLALRRRTLPAPVLVDDRIFTMTGDVTPGSE